MTFKDYFSKTFETSDNHHIDTLRTHYSADGNEIKDNGNYGSTMNRVIVQIEGVWYLVDMYVFYNSRVVAKISRT